MIYDLLSQADTHSFDTVMREYVVLQVLAALDTALTLAQSLAVSLTGVQISHDKTILSRDRGGKWGSLAGIIFYVFISRWYLFSSIPARVFLDAIGSSCWAAR